MSVKGEVRSPAASIVFTIITCGIYGWIWMYKMTQELKKYLGREDLNPGLDILLSIICFPYVYYWSYRNGKLIAEAQSKAGIPVEDNAILYLILAIFSVSVFGLFPIALAIMQSQLNRIWLSSSNNN